MKAAESVLEMVMSPKPRQAPTVKSWRFIDLKPHSLPWSSIAGFSNRLGIEPSALLRLIGVSERTAARRKEEGYLKPDEADRLLRIGRVFEEAVRIFGEERRAVGWLNHPTPYLYNATPLSLLDSDGGAQAVSEELGRIDWGDFA
jgi:putative toxin-antitoxin system antitoxin component (TIGR02293 family)